MNFAKDRRIRWDFNEKVEKSKLKEILSEFEKIKNDSSIIEVVDLHNINSNAYTIPNKDFQIRYKI